LRKKRSKRDLETDPNQCDIIVEQAPAKPKAAWHTVQNHQSSTIFSYSILKAKKGNPSDGRAGFTFFYFDADIFDPSKISPTGISWEWDDVSDVVKTSGEKDHPLEAKAKPAVLHRSKAPEVQVPLIRLQGQICVEYSAEQD
jgi:hypothetical protein